MGKKDDERFWNLIKFKIYATDEELENAAPLLFIVIVIVIVGAIILF